MKIQKDHLGALKVSQPLWSMKVARGEKTMEMQNVAKKSKRNGQRGLLDEARQAMKSENGQMEGYKLGQKGQNRKGMWPYEKGRMKATGIWTKILYHLIAVVSFKVGISLFVCK